MRKCILLFFILLLSLCFSNGGFDLSAQNAILVDGDCGHVLYEKNSGQRSAPASLTKLMTALCAYECVTDLSEVCSVSAYAAGTEGSSIYLKPGEQITVKTLFYGLLLESGNDAAVALAEYCDGNTDDFVFRMNRKAQELGLSNTHFSNPTGLPQEDHYSSAADLAFLLTAFSDNEWLLEVSGTKSYSAEGHRFANHNKLLWQYENCIGGKTGYTQSAGRCLATIALIRGRRYVAVTLRAGDDWKDHQTMFAMAEKCFVSAGVTQKSLSVDLPVAGQNRQVLCTAKENVRIFLPNYLLNDLNFQFDAPHFLYSDIPFEAEVGTAWVYAGNVLTGKAPIYLSERISQGYEGSSRAAA